MRTFKVGDKVRCIDDSGHPRPLQKNKAYRVSNAPAVFGGNVWLVGIDDCFSYSPSRFEKVLPNPTRKTFTPPKF